MDKESLDLPFQSGTSSMTVQITTETGIPKLHCPFCNKALSTLASCMKHVKKHEPPGGFLCRYCDDRYCSDEELKRHLHEVHTTIACRICKDITFNNEFDYREHIRGIHNGVDREMYKCSKCGAEYKTIEPYRRHVTTECGSIKPYKCDLCPMAFVTKYNLKQHKDSHSGEKKYCCSYCGKNFLQKGRLVEHERSHTGEKPYKCDVCGKCFAHRESIVTHSSIHTGIRLVQCKCCLSRFSCYSNLIKHRRSRADTCGLTQYDPPKNRVRTHRSRIPPALNPTSEIKVSSLNKVIKPGDKEHPKLNSIKDNISTENPKIKKTRKSLNKPNDQCENEQNIERSKTFNSNISRRTRSAKCPRNEKFNTKETQLDNFGATNNENDEDRKRKLKLPMPILNLKNDLNEISDSTHNIDEFEYSNTTEFVSDNPNIKSEDENIFNEKDKLLDVFLSENRSESELSNSDCISQKHDIKIEGDDDILEETELVIIKGEDFDEKDILAIENEEEEDPTNCSSVLGNISEAYPNSKEEASIKVSTNASGKIFNCENVKLLRKYRKPIDDQNKEKKNSPKRVAKISQHELKARIKMFKEDEKSWSCPYCIKIYHMRKPYEKHLRENHNRPENEIKEMFKSDNIGIINEDIFKCHVCDKIYLVEKRLLAHLQLHGPKGNLTFKCPCYCSIYFACKEEAITHAQREHRDLLFCEQCQKFMTGHDSLKNHIKNHHSEKEPKHLKRNLVCDKCGKKLSGRTTLTDHMRSDCGRQPLYPCTICGKHLTTAGILKTHLLLHKDDTPFQCDKCGKTFKVKAQYKTHLKTRHTEFKPFKCHLCPKEYPYRESLLTHMTVHTGIKRFLCNGCGKRFTCISNLQAHRKVHADTCGILPLNAKATQYMGVQKGNLLLGSKPKAGFEYNETNTLLAKEVIDRDLPIAQELNYPSEPTAPLLTVPLNSTQPPPVHLLTPQYIGDSESSVYN